MPMPAAQPCLRGRPLHSGAALLRVRLDDAAGVDRHGRRTAARKFDIVRDEHERGTVRAVQFEHQVDDGMPGGRIEAAGRLVGEENRRARDECACKRDALLLAPDNSFG